MHVSFVFDLTHESILWICHLYYIIPTMMLMMMMIIMAMIRYVMQSCKRKEEIHVKPCMSIFETKVANHSITHAETEKKHEMILITILCSFFSFSIEYAWYGVIFTEIIVWSICWASSVFSIKFFVNRIHCYCRVENYESFIRNGSMLMQINSV